MKVQATRKIVVEDYPAEMQDLVRRLATNLNPHLEQVSLALGNSLTLTDNFKATTWSIVLAAGTTTIKLPWALNEQPKSVTIGQILRDGGTVPTTTIVMYWTYGTATVDLTFIGLDAATKYRVNIIGVV